MLGETSEYSRPHLLVEEFHKNNTLTLNMPTLRHNHASRNPSRSPESSVVSQPQSRQRIRAASDADSLDQRIAGLVLSNALPPAPPEVPSLYDQVNEHYRQVRNIRRRIGREILAVNQLIRESQHVALGRNLSLLVQLNEYSQCLSELRTRRVRVRDWMAENPDIDPNEFVHSSDDEEPPLGCDPAPILDYGSDSDGPEEVRFHIGEGHHAPTIALRTADIDTYLRNPYRQRRAGQAGTTRGQRGPQGLEISNLERDPEDADESNLEESSNADTEELESEEEPEYTSDESEEDMASGLAYEDSPASNGESAQFEEDEEGRSAPTQSEAEVDGDSQQPDDWQAFHQYFMYSCRGDLAAVTSQLQGQFDFVPEITQAWVGRQLNNTLYIEEQTLFLAVYLPGETGTQDRAAARWQMAGSDFFIQDTVSSPYDV